MEFSLYDPCNPSLSDSITLIPQVLYMPQEVDKLYDISEKQSPFLALSEVQSTNFS